MKNHTLFKVEKSEISGQQIGMSKMDKVQCIGLVGFLPDLPKFDQDA